MLVFSFTFRFLIEFELLLFMVYRKGPTLFFYMCMPSFPNIIFEETVLSPLNDLRTLVKNHWTYIWGFISGLSIVFCVYMCLWDSITLFCLLLLLNQFWNQEMWALYFVSLFEQYLGYLVLLFFLFFFWDCICILVWIFWFCKNAIWILIGIALHL